MIYNSFTETLVIRIFSICLTDDWILNSLVGGVVLLTFNVNFGSHMVFSSYVSIINIHYAMIFFGLIGSLQELTEIS